MLKVVIIDDEPLAVEVLQNHLQKIPDVHVVGACKNAIEAFAFVTKNEVDLMLLDINMPEITGIEFLSSLKEPPMVIFTTAYSEYAFKSYELDAVDYLLKPISFERLNKAITKALSNKQLKTQQASETANTLLFVRSEGKWIKIDVNGIWFVEGLKDYVR
ncbi:MAG: LytR/AlgR family response regulator transcription factor, partial [Bacteroidia bacterium]